MSLATICGVTVVRSLVISLISVFIARHLSSRLNEDYSKRSFLLLVLILAPFLVPELIVGYTWSLISLKLVHYPVFIELIYACLVLLKVVPVGIVCFYFSAPTAISPEADFIRSRLCSTSASISGMKSQWSFFLWKTVLRTFPVWALLFLLTFQEFEMASLIYRDSWTVWIFDAQAGGVPISETIPYLIGPLLIELFITTGVILLFSRLQHQTRVNLRDQIQNRSVCRSILAWGYLLTAFFVVVVIPFSLMGWSGVLSLGNLFQNQLQLAGILRECAWGLLYGISAGIAAWGLAVFFFSKNQSRFLKVFGFLCCLPGLCGSLTLALGIATLFLTEFGHRIYDTPSALFIALVFYLFPRAAFLKLIFSTRWQNDSLFLAQLLSFSKNQQQAIKGGHLDWVVQGKMQYGAVVILSFWAYWDVTINSILAPNQTMSSSVRLYGLMHYGQNSILSAMTFLSLCIPVLVSILLFPVVKKLWITISGRFNMNHTV